MVDFDHPAVGATYAEQINAGYSARLYGHEQDACPHPAATVERAAWLHGYSQACDHVHGVVA